ncbi:uncharacterized protein [Typha angustifolia]|uniref:uncharacterized protein n=1 Tax=Typha angustifolia TaxID=59011 RepID=UPI003C2D2B5E
MEGIGGGDIYRLPEECVSQVISRTSPRDSCRCSAVSTAIRAAADSDAVWSRFLPPDIHSIVSRAIDPLPESTTKKGLFLSLCDRPILVDGGKMSFALDRLSSGKCYMLSARSLSITWGHAPQYWRWISQPDSRFAEVAKLLDVCWLDIRGKIESKLLSQNTTYAAYLIFKVNRNNYGFSYTPQKTTVSLGAHVSTHTVCLVPDDNEEEAPNDDEETFDDNEEEAPNDDEEAERLGAFDSTRNFFLWPNDDEEASDDSEEEALNDDEEAERSGAFDSTHNFFPCPNDDKEALDDNEEAMPDNEEEAPNNEAMSDNEEEAPNNEAAPAPNNYEEEAPNNEEASTDDEEAEEGAMMRLGAFNSSHNFFLWPNNNEEASDNNEEASDNNEETEERTTINVRYPKRRDDGWMEMEMGDFYNEEGEDGEVEMILKEIGGHWKSGLVFQGIEVRPKNREMERYGVDGDDISRLPEECVSHVISMTSPSDSCRCAAVSTAFRSAADSDGVWNRFLPSDLPSILSRAVDPPAGYATKKDLYFRLCDLPLLLDGGKMSFQLERSSGGKCYMLSARSLLIVWGGTMKYWRWISLPDSRFTEVAQLLNVCWLEIRGKIESKMLSRNTTYAAYLIFKTKGQGDSFSYKPQKTMVRLGSHVSHHDVCLAPDSAETRGNTHMYRNFLNWRGVPTLPHVGDAEQEATRNVRCPQKRDDGWMEMEMGEFYNEEGDDGEVEMSLMEIKGGHWKTGLILQGIEVRPKK